MKKVHNPLITVITINYNNEANVEKTIKSVVGQSYKNIEYIIVDGSSTDDSMAIINNYSNNGNIKIVSEPDNGIYDAMNKGIKLANGDYINFMNSGDCFHDENVMEHVVDNIRKKNADIYYGDVINIYNENRKERGRSITLKELKHSQFILSGNMPNHQTMFIRSNLLKKQNFNLQYKIRADYDWFLSQLNWKNKIVYMESVICDFDKNGVSSHSFFRKKWKYETDKIIRSRKRLLYLAYSIYNFIFY